MSHVPTSPTPGVPVPRGPMDGKGVCGETGIFVGWMEVASVPPVCGKPLMSRRARRVPELIKTIKLMGFYRKKLALLLSQLRYQTRPGLVALWGTRGGTGLTGSGRCHRNRQCSLRGAERRHGNSRLPLSARAASPWEPPMPRLRGRGVATGTALVTPLGAGRRHRNHRCLASGGRGVALRTTPPSGGGRSVAMGTA